MLGVGFNDTLPLSCANFSVDLAVDFLHQVVFVSLVVEKIAIACFTRKDYFSVWIEAASDFGINKHSVAARAERPSVRGVPGNV